MYRPLPSIGSKSCLWVVGWMYQVDVYLRIPTGGDGGWDEHPGGLPGVRVAPGHGAQDSGLLSAAGLPATDSAPAS